MVDIKRSPQKSRRKYLVPTVVVLLVALATFKLLTLDPAVPSVERATILIDTVKRGDLVRDVRGPGSLVPERIRWITAQASARVERLHTESGRSVKAGEPIMELSNPDLQIQTMEAEQQARQAEMDLLTLRTSLQTGILAQEGVVASTRTMYVSATQEARAADSLARLGLAPEFDLANRRASAEEYTTRLRVEQEKLALMKSTIDSQIVTQTSRIAQLRAIAARQQARLNSLQLSAPEDGVLQELDLQPGQWVPEGTTLAKIVQPGKLKAVLRIPEALARDINLGQSASVDTRNGIVPGHVVRKDPAAQNGSLTIDVALDGPLPDGAVPDLSVDGSIVTDNLHDVLYAGRISGASAGVATTIFRLSADGRTAVRVPVVLGRSSVNFVEIVEGLSVGDAIILSDMSAHQNTEKIRIR